MKRSNSNTVINDQFLKLLKTHCKTEEYKFIVDKILPGVKSSGENSVSVELRSKIDLSITFLQAHLNLGPYLNLLVSLGKFCIQHGELEIAEDLLSKVITKHKKLKLYDNQAAQAYVALAEIAVVQANWVETNRYLRNARALFASKNDKQGLGEIENFLGTIYGEKGNTELAKKHFESALLILKKKQNSLLKSKIEMNLGIIHIMLENLDEAINLLTSALQEFKKRNESKLIAEANHNLGMLHLRKRANSKAITYFENCLNIAVHEEIYPIVSMAYLGASETYLNMGDIDKADLYSTLGLASCLMINDRLTAADIYKIKGRVEANRGTFETAEAYFLTSLRINEELQNEMNYAETAESLALLYKENDRNDQSKEYFEKACEYYVKNNCKEKLEEIKTHL